METTSTHGDSTFSRSCSFQKCGTGSLLVSFSDCWLDRHVPWSPKEFDKIVLVNIFLVHMHVFKVCLHSRFTRSMLSLATERN